jgi:hypothetical protein
MKNLKSLYSKTRLLLLAALVFGSLQFPSNAVAVPAAPSSITAVASTSGAHLNGSITVRWGAVTGATAYAVRLTRQSSADAPITGSVNGQNNTEITFNSLIGGATYIVQVRTVQVLDLSEWSADTLTSQPKTAPKAPGAPTAVAANASARVSWTKVADADNGGFAINSYLVTETQSGRSVSVAGTLDLADVTGLTRGASATFTVTAINAANPTGTTSLPSDSVLLSDVPGTPSAPTLATTSGTTTVSAAWVAPTANGGDPLVGYTVNLYKDGLIAATRLITSLTDLTTSFTSLAVGTYTVRVSAANSIGSGALSVDSNAVSIAAPPSGGGGGGGGGGGTVPPTPTASPSPSPSPTSTPTPTPSPTISPTPTPSPSPTISPTPTPIASPSASPSPTVSPTPSPTPTPTPTIKALNYTVKNGFFLVSTTNKNVKINKLSTQTRSIVLARSNSLKTEIKSLKKGTPIRIYVKNSKGVTYKAVSTNATKNGTYLSPGVRFSKAGRYQLITLIDGKKRVLSVVVK